MKINAKEERPKIHFLVILTIIAAALILYLIFWAREAHPIAVCSIAERSASDCSVLDRHCIFFCCGDQPRCRVFPADPI